MKIRKGDRFRFKAGGDIWEYTGNSGGDSTYTHEGICVDVGNCTTSHLGEIDTWDFEDKFFWDYLGNFSKGNNFNELYNKLNEKR